MKIGHLNLTPEFEQLNEGIKIARTDDDINAWFDENRFKTNYTISGGKVTADEFIMVGHNDIRGLGVQFDKIDGDFELSHNEKLATLKGSPTEVGGSYTIKGKSVKSLERGPKIIHGNCVISGTDISTMDGAPTAVGGSLTISLNPKLTSLKGGPNKVGLDVIIAKNVLLQNLNGLPEEIGRDLDLSKLMSGSLKGIGRVKSCKMIRVAGVTSNILGLIMIDDLRDVIVTWQRDYKTPGYNEKKLEKALEILKPYFGKGRGDKKIVFEAQEKLIDADLDEYAEL